MQWLGGASHWLNHVNSVCDRFFLWSLMRNKLIGSTLSTKLNFVVNEVDLISWSTKINEDQWRWWIWSVDHPMFQPRTGTLPEAQWAHGLTPYDSIYPLQQSGATCWSNLHCASGYAMAWFFHFIFIIVLLEWWKRHRAYSTNLKLAKKIVFQKKRNV